MTQDGAKGEGVHERVVHSSKAQATGLFTDFSFLSLAKAHSIQFTGLSSISL